MLFSLAACAVVGGVLGSGTVLAASEGISDPAEADRRTTCQLCASAAYSSCSCSAADAEREQQSVSFRVHCRLELRTLLTLPDWIWPAASALSIMLLPILRV